MGTKAGSILIPVLILSLATGLAGADRQWKDVSVRVGDIKTHYIEAGTGDRHLLFIPGLMMNAEVWKEQIPYFVARGFHVIAMDPRSQGLSTITETGNTYHQHAADLHAFLEKLKLEHCIVVGWAAAVVTLLEYVSSPEVLLPDRLILVNGGPGGLNDKDYPGGFVMKQARELALAMEDDRPKAAEAYVRSLFKSRMGEPVYGALMGGSLKTPTGTAVALLFDLITEDRRSALAGITVPTLIITSQDRQLLGEYMQSKIPGAQLKVIEDAGHAVFLEKPQAFNQALEDFLSK